MNNTFINDIHYFRIPVRNLEESVDFYTKTLGFNLLTITEEPFAIIKINEGPFLIILVPTEDNSYAHFTVNGGPEFSIGFTSPEIEKFHQHLSENGVKVESIEEDNGHYYFHFYDPSGNKLQVHW